VFKNELHRQIVYFCVISTCALSRLGEISEYINQLSFDLKAEMLLAILVEQRIRTEEILAVFDGQLRRAWSRDVSRSTVDRLESGNQMLCLHLNRDGIYDTLPEALFHSSSGFEDQSAKEMAKDSMKIRNEEKEARKFFQPFENEIFLQRVHLAMTENKLFERIYSDLLTGVIPDLWKTDNDFPEIFVTRLKKMLPLINQVAGDLPLTAQCLECIIDERVEVNCENNPDEGAETFDSIFSGILGKSTLGIDTVSGERVSNIVSNLIFSIGPITDNETGNLVREGRMDGFVNCYYSYFVPFEYEVKTEYIFGTEQGKFMLYDDADKEASYLGYNSVI
jgi:hypothetical protein